MTLVTPHNREELYLADEAATASLARAIAALARRGDLIALFGELGAGKTAFARAFINAIPHPDKVIPEEVPSPTFTLVQVYERSPAPVWHIDLYRIDHPEDAYEIGLEEALADGITLIEWPERLGPLLPRARLDVNLAFAANPQARIATISGSADWQRRLQDLGLGD